VSPWRSVNMTFHHELRSFGAPTVRKRQKPRHARCVDANGSIEAMGDELAACDHATNRLSRTARRRATSSTARSSGSAKTLATTHRLTRCGRKVPTSRRNDRQLPIILMPVLPSFLRSWWLTSELVPHWVAPGPHKVRRCVPALPFSSEVAQLRRLKRSLAFTRTLEQGGATRSRTVTYDTARRLESVSEVGPGALSETFAFTPAGRLDSRSKFGQYTYDDEHPHALGSVVGCVVALAPTR
jgi:hypothetical protein